MARCLGCDMGWPRVHGDALRMTTVHVLPYAGCVASADFLHVRTVAEQQLVVRPAMRHVAQDQVTELCMVVQWLDLEFFDVLEVVVGLACALHPSSPAARSVQIAALVRTWLDKAEQGRTGVA